jgi:amino acid permease
MGVKGKIFILILNSLSSFGSCMSYISNKYIFNIFNTIFLVIFLKLIPNLVTLGTGDTFFSNKTILSLILSIWLLIYCYQKDVSGIKAAAYWGVLGIVSFLFLEIANMLIWSYYEMISEDNNINYININIYDYDVYSSIATIILSFSFHTYTFSIYECIENPDPRKMIVTSSIGIFTSTLIYLLVGTIGYILYGNNILDSILDTMGYTNISILMSISFVVNVVMSFPITFNSLHHYVIYLIEMILTMLKDMCHKKSKKEIFLNSNIKNSENKKKESDNDNQTSSDSEEEETEEDNDHKKSSHAHHKMVRLPEYVEYIVVFGLFVLIFYTANMFPNIKTVKYLKIL